MMDLLSLAFILIVVVMPLLALGAYVCEYVVGILFPLSAGKKSLVRETSTLYISVCKTAVKFDDDNVTIEGECLERARYYFYSRPNNWEKPGSSSVDNTLARADLLALILSQMVDHIADGYWAWGTVYDCICFMSGPDDAKLAYEVAVRMKCIYWRASTIVRNSPKDERTLFSLMRFGLSHNNEQQ